MHTECVYKWFLSQLDHEAVKDKLIWARKGKKIQVTEWTHKCLLKF